MTAPSTLSACPPSISALIPAIIPSSSTGWQRTSLPGNGTPESLIALTATTAAAKFPFVSHAPHPQILFPPLSPPNGRCPPSQSRPLGTEYYFPSLNTRLPR